MPKLGVIAAATGSNVDDGDIFLDDLEEERISTIKEREGSETRGRTPSMFGGDTNPLEYSEEYHTHEVQVMRMSRKKVHQRRQRELVRWYLPLLIPFLVYVFAWRDLGSSYFVVAIGDDLLVKQDYLGYDNAPQSFREIYLQEHWYEWLYELVIPTLFPLSGDTTHPGLRRRFLASNRLVGAVRLRQWRVQRSSCNDHVFEDDCYPKYTTSNSAPEHSLFGRDNSYQIVGCDVGTGVYEGSVFFEAREGNYGCPSSYIDIPFSSTFNESKEVVKQLERNEWLDVATRGVVVEFFTFNPFYNAMSSHKLFVEFTAGGHTYTKSKSRLFKINVLNGGWDYAFLCIQIAGFLYILASAGWFFRTYIKTVTLKGKGQIISYLMGWPGVEFCSYVLFIATLWCRVAWFIDSSRVEYASGKFDHSVYPRLDHLKSLWRTETFLCAMNCGLILMRLFKFMNTNPRLNLLIRTLSHASGTLFGLLSIFFITLISFSMMGYIVFNDQLPEFITFGRVFWVLFRVLLGDTSIYVDMRDVSPGFTSMFFLMYTTIAFFVILNMILAVIVDSFQHEVADDKGSKPILMQLKKKLSKYRIGTAVTSFIHTDEIDLTSVNPDWVIDKLKRFREKFPTIQHLTLEDFRAVMDLSEADAMHLMLCMDTDKSGVIEMDELDEIAKHKEKLSGWTYGWHVSVTNDQGVPIAQSFRMLPGASPRGLSPASSGTLSYAKAAIMNSLYQSNLNSDNIANGVTLKEPDTPVLPLKDHRDPRYSFRQANSSFSRDDVDGSDYKSEYGEEVQSVLSGFSDGTTKEQDPGVHQKPKIEFTLPSDADLMQSTAVLTGPAANVNPKHRPSFFQRMKGKVVLGGSASGHASPAPSLRVHKTSAPTSGAAAGGGAGNDPRRGNRRNLAARGGTLQQIEVAVAQVVNRILNQKLTKYQTELRKGFTDLELKIDRQCADIKAALGIIGGTNINNHSFGSISSNNSPSNRRLALGLMGLNTTTATSEKDKNNANSPDQSNTESAPPTPLNLPMDQLPSFQPTHGSGIFGVGDMLHRYHRETQTFVSNVLISHTDPLKANLADLMDQVRQLHNDNEQCNTMIHDTKHLLMDYLPTAAPKDQLHFPIPYIVEQQPTLTNTLINGTKKDEIFLSGSRRSSTVSSVNTVVVGQGTTNNPLFADTYRCASFQLRKQSNGAAPTNSSTPSSPLSPSSPHNLSTRCVKDNSSTDSYNNTSHNLLPSRTHMVGGGGGGGDGGAATVSKTALRPTTANLKHLTVNGNHDGTRSRRGSNLTIVTATSVSSNSRASRESRRTGDTQMTTSISSKATLETAPRGTTDDPPRSSACLKALPASPFGASPNHKPPGGGETPNNQLSNQQKNRHVYGRIQVAKNTNDHHQVPPHHQGTTGQATSDPPNRTNTPNKNNHPEGDVLVGYNPTTTHTTSAHHRRQAYNPSLMDIIGEQL